MSNEELNKAEELGTPSHQQKIKNLKQEKDAKKQYKVVKSEIIERNGKRIKIMTMSDKSKKQVYLGKILKKNKLAVRNED